MILNLPIIMSGSAILFAAGMIAKILRSKEPPEAIAAEPEDCVLLHGGSGGRIASRLRRSRATVDACLVAIRDTELAAALVERSTSGVRVRVIVHGSDDPGSLVTLLLESGVEVKVKSGRERLGHNFLVVDAAAVGEAATLLAGALGAVKDGTLYDSTLITTTPFVAATFAMEFERLWAKF